MDYFNYSGDDEVAVDNDDHDVVVGYGDDDADIVKLLLLFVWNTLTVAQTVSITIPLHRDPLRVDVAGLQGMQ